MKSLGGVIKNEAHRRQFIKYSLLIYNTLQEEDGSPAEKSFFLTLEEANSKKVFSGIYSG